MGLFDIFKKKKNVEIKQEFENNAAVEPNSQIFQRVYEVVSDYLPKGWKNVAIYYAVSGNMTHFKYYVSSGKGYINCFNLKECSKENFRKIRSGLDIILLEDRKNLEQSKQWSVFTMFISSAGNFQTKFGYDDISEDFLNYHENWEKENIKNK